MYMYIATLKIHWTLSDITCLCAVSSYPLEMETKEYVDSIPIEEEDEVQDYTYQEHQQEHTTVPEPVEEPSAFQQTAEDTVQEILPAPEEPVGEAPKLSYASIVSSLS